MWSSLFFIKVCFFLPQIAQIDKSILISFCNTWIFASSIFLQLTQNIFIVFICYIPQKFQDFLFLFSFHNILLKHYLLKENSYWLIYELIKDSEIKTSIVFNLDFPNSNILSCFFFFFVILDNSWNDCTKLYYHCITLKTNRNTS